MNDEPIFKATNRRTGRVIMVSDFKWFAEKDIHDMFGEDSDGEFWELEFVWRKGCIDYSDILDREVKARAAAYKRQNDLADDGGIPTYKLD